MKVRWKLLISSWVSVDIKLLILWNEWSWTLLLIGLNYWCNELLIVIELQSWTYGRVQQLAYVAFVRTSTFIGIHMILDMYILTRMLIFSFWIFTVFKIFIVLIISYCLKTYCNIFELYLICLSLKETDSWLFTFVLKKPHFSIFHTNYLANISPYLRALADLQCQ